jgi:hypothetical protein
VKVSWQELEFTVWLQLGPGYVQKSSSADVLLMEIVVKLRCATRAEAKLRESLSLLKDAPTEKGVSPEVESDVVFWKVQPAALVSKVQVGPV